MGERPRSGFVQAFAGDDEVLMYEPPTLQQPQQPQQRQATAATNAGGSGSAAPRRRAPAPATARPDYERALFIANSDNLDAQATRLLNMCLAGKPIPRNIPSDIFTRFRSLRQLAKAEGVQIPQPGPCYGKPRFDSSDSEAAASLLIAKSEKIDAQATNLLNMCMSGTPLPNDIDPDVFARFRSLRQRAKTSGMNVPKPCYAQPRFDLSKDEPAAKARAGPAPLPDDGVPRCNFMKGRAYCGKEYCKRMPDGSYRCEHHDEVLQKQRAGQRAAKKREMAELKARAEWRRDNPGVPYPGDAGGAAESGSESSSESGSESDDESDLGDFIDDKEQDADWRRAVGGTRRPAPSDSDSDDGASYRMVAL